MNNRPGACRRWLTDLHCPKNNLNLGMKTDLFTDVADEMILYSVYVCLVCVPDKNQLVFFVHNSFCLML